MKPIQSFQRENKPGIRYVLTDIDDTLTVNGRLPAVVFAAMERLQGAGIRVIPITGRPAGWCDHIARMWPVDGLVGENGAFYFYYDRHGRKMIRRFWKPAEERRTDRDRLDAIRETVLAEVPGCGVSADQAYREADLAIDFCEDVPALPAPSVAAIKAIFEAAGATAKISSIHVNGWFGAYDKLSMSRLMFKEVFDVDLDAVRDRVIFCGDSPNDSPMFGFFPHSVGVANVRVFGTQLEAPPTWVTRAEGGFGFAEMVKILLD
ncbi:haloacid dehalogenase [Desulfosarcina alkanivorans]|uniref:Haloacid dehalogenase n=1 Tax=Desulfosarcina alkanivorans TaxID=571177 RepID=A0A5K7YP93_9BACT|nr:HAD-IIB family hydrolase [Desulfosarcina alkanivorans]BBO70135.1 haloacid dehalogenase [Desulfosarcina alkanivorans]